MKHFFALLVLIVSCAGVLYADEMSSQHYSITSDSVNAGGILSTSTNYKLEDTAGDIATGISSSTNFLLYAGYQKQQMTDIALTPGGDVVMSPSIGGITGGTANGSSTFTVTSSNDPGYMVTIKASSSPALTTGSESFADYTPAGVVPDFTFSVDAGTSEFGFSPEGTDIHSKFLDNGVACGTGSSDTALSCWDALSTSDQTIVQRMSATASTGSQTTLNFRAAIGSGKIQPEGVYVSTTTITVLPL
ncbi:MAG: hypothetical protein RLY57_48 [Candidatus Parcubacteria bacterium]|jgi:hypothetical protein